MNNILNHLYYFAAGNGLVDTSPLPQAPANQDTLNKVFLIVFTIMGAVCLLLVVLAGTRYVFSKGEPNNIQSAKNEIKYALMGLALIALAAVIVNFVLLKLK